MFKVKNKAELLGVALLLVVAFDCVVNLALVDEVNYRTSWGFHRCVTETLDAHACYEGYTYYPPLVHLLARVIPLEAIMVLAVVGVFAASRFACGNWFGGACFYLIGAFWTYTAFKGGLVPFSVIMFLVVLSVAFWDKFAWWARLLVTAAALFTHNLAGWFFVGCAVVLTLVKDKTRALTALLVLSLLAFAFTLFFFAGRVNPTMEYRPVWFVALFASLLFGRLLGVFVED